MFLLEYQTCPNIFGNFRDKNDVYYYVKTDQCKISFTSLTTNVITTGIGSWKQDWNTGIWSAKVVFTTPQLNPVTVILNLISETLLSDSTNSNQFLRADCMFPKNWRDSGAPLPTQ